MNDPILLDFPDHFETERLLIRSPRPGDGPEFNAAILDSLDGLRTWLGRYVDAPPTVEESEAVVRKAHARFLLREDLMLVAFLKGSNTLVVSSGLHNVNWRVPKFEIGYWARTPYQGQGYVTEAVRGISDFALNVLGARRLAIYCDTENHRSAAVARRSGFELEATMPFERRRSNGSLRNTYLFSRVRPEE
jgi:RimJ/RimL family protein N-acetyltransferase